MDGLHLHPQVTCASPGTCLLQHVCIGSAWVVPGMAPLSPRWLVSSRDALSGFCHPRTGRVPDVPYIQTLSCPVFSVGVCRLVFWNPQVSLVPELELFILFGVFLFCFFPF